jgi:hypothetical protein
MTPEENEAARRWDQETEAQFMEFLSDPSRPEAHYAAVGEKYQRAMRGNVRDRSVRPA